MSVEQKSTLSTVEVEAIAERLDIAWRTKVPILPISETDSVSDISTAYAIQTHWTYMRLARGEKIVGHKIGLTNKAIQQQLNVSEPDYGSLWHSSFYKAEGGKVSIETGDFIHPRIEGEIAFLIGKPLQGPKVTADDIVKATEACALAVEIVDSRIADWKIKLADTIADNASYGGFTVGPWDKNMVKTDLSALGMKVHHGGRLVAEGMASAVLGNPANSTAWLVNRLWEFGVSVQPGDIVISGAITKMLPAKAGDEFVFSLDGQPELSVRFK